MHWSQERPWCKLNCLKTVTTAPWDDVLVLVHHIQALNTQPLHQTWSLILNLRRKKRGDYKWELEEAQCVGREHELWLQRKCKNTGSLIKLMRPLHSAAAPVALNNNNGPCKIPCFRVQTRFCEIVGDYIRTLNITQGMYHSCIFVGPQSLAPHQDNHWPLNTAIIGEAGLRMWVIASRTG